MSQQQLDKNYDSPAVEARWGKFWIEENLFHVEAEGPGSSFTIVIPPPNVTGSLHIGHALNNTLQDILIRWRRMQGHKTLWLP
ncbi:MAG: class I tRNA ligase family protein, partial [Nitrospirota bacterium]